MKRTLIQTLTAILIVASFSVFGMAAEQARVNIDIAGHPFAGPENAPITLVVFSDYL